MTTQPNPIEAPVHCHKSGKDKHYTELARITAWLFVGLIALMTFLLAAGLQHPQKWFSFFIYASIVALPLGLIAFTIGHSLQLRLSDLTHADDSKADAIAKSRKQLRLFRFFQQLLFVLGLLAITGLALVSAHIFFTPAPAPSASVQGQ
jgi:hypothetical protein